MKWFFDTSVLVPVLIEDHIHHERSLAAFRRADPNTSCCAAHSLAEVFATITRLPAPYRASGEQAILFLESVEERVTLVSLEGREYLRAIRRAAADGVLGATIYDALLATCALKAGAQIIYTWNERHFRMFDPEIAVRIRTP